MLNLIDLKKICLAIAREVELETGIILVPSTVKQINDTVTTVEFQNGWKAKFDKNFVEIWGNIGEHPDIWDRYKINWFKFQGQERVYISGIA